MPANYIGRDLIQKHFDSFKTIRNLLSNDFDSFNNIFETMYKEFDNFNFNSAYSEDENNFIYEIDVPGANKEDIKIVVNNGDDVIANSISIEYSRKNKSKNQNNSYTFSIPKKANIDKIETSLELGVLKIIIPKIKVEEIKQNQKIIKIK